MDFQIDGERERERERERGMTNIKAAFCNFAKVLKRRLIYLRS
jgi:hypothetical protein